MAATAGSSAAAGAAYYFEDRSALRLDFRRDSIWTERDRRDPRQFVRAVDLARLGPDFMIGGAELTFDKMLGTGREARVQFGVNDFQDGNLQGFLYGHYQFIVNDRPGLWTALRPNVYWETFDRRTPAYFSPDGFYAVGGMWHNILSSPLWRLEAELNPRLDLARRTRQLRPARRDRRQPRVRAGVGRGRRLHVLRSPLRLLGVARRRAARRSPGPVTRRALAALLLRALASPRACRCRRRRPAARHSCKPAGTSTKTLPTRQRLRAGPHARRRRGDLRGPVLRAAARGVAGRPGDIRAGVRRGPSAHWRAPTGCTRGGGRRTAAAACWTPTPPPTPIRTWRWR